MNRLFLAAALLLASCAGTPAPERVRIAVVSDLHYMAPELLVSPGEAFQKYVDGDRKLIAQSAAIAASLVDSLVALRPDVVLVSGDMTKDGELLSHQGVLRELGRLREAGIEVLVTPGNHDVESPVAVAYDGAQTTPVEAVTEDEFRSLYGDYGYDRALDRGPGLSYVAEPAPGLWVVSLDATRHGENRAAGASITAGRLSAAQLEWALVKTREGVEAGKVVLGLMHHGVVEHFPGQATLFPEYVVEDWPEMATALADAGMGAVFTGHFHAQDVVEWKTPAGHTIRDVETGSAVTWPCPYRVGTLVGGQLSLRTRYVEAIAPAAYPAGQPFPAYARGFLSEGLLGVAKWVLLEPPYNLAEEQVDGMAPLLIETLTAHYKGDETALSAHAQPILDALLAAPESAPMGRSIEAILRDTPPADNEVAFSVK